MLQDPENPCEEWENFVWAANLEAARSQCEAIASDIELTEVINVTQAMKKGEQGRQLQIHLLVQNGETKS